MFWHLVRTNGIRTWPAADSLTLASSLWAIFRQRALVGRNVPTCRLAEIYLSKIKARARIISQPPALHSKAPAQRKIVAASAAPWTDATSASIIECTSSGGLSCTVSPSSVAPSTVPTRSRCSVASSMTLGRASWITSMRDLETLPVPGSRPFCSSLPRPTASHSNSNAEPSVLCGCALLLRRGKSASSIACAVSKSSE